MLAKLTAKNQLTLPKAATAAVGATEYFEVETRDGTIVLTPVRIQRGDAVRAKLAALALTAADVEDAVTWARTRVRAADPGAASATRAGVPERRSEFKSTSKTAKKPRKPTQRKS